MKTEEELKGELENLESQLKARGFDMGKVYDKKKSFFSV